MKYDMVVARYKEDISWLNNLSDLNINKIIYNKFDKESIILENVGRESHTYLYHVVNNYENLADVTIFTQANPFDHSPNFINLVKNSVSSEEKISFKHLTFSHGSDMLHCDLDGLPHHPSLNLNRGFKKIFKNPNIQIVPFHPGAIFMVSKENIQKRSKDFYQSCIELCLDEEWKDQWGTLAAPYFFERAWRTIFFSDIE